ncbi:MULTISPECIES: hypothetical protein [unclassified Chryseobacterium]|uniref:hypothetical protein n=1 Tax=unclassified Chryseobacterium TaxID=2593645 RepID=UPI001E4B7E62|nr:MULTISPECIES: hypothetical protein [unclassified Chryseobacterium]
MKPIKALGVHQGTSVKIPKIDRISALGISPKNRYGHFDEKNGTTYFHTFLPYGDINKLVEEYNDPVFLKNQSNTDLLIFYLLGSKNELYMAITNRSKYYLEALTSQNVYKFEGYDRKMTFKEYVITNIIADKKEAFLFTYEEILSAFNDAIEDYKFVTSEQNSKQESKFTVPSQVLKYRINLKEKGIIKLLQEVNRTIAKMRAEEKYAYNEWIMSKADPYNYFGIRINNSRDFSSQDLKQLITQLKNYKKKMGILKDGGIKSIEDMNSFVEENLTAGGSMFKWFIDTPFFSLNPDQRKKYIEMYCEKDESSFPRFSISGGLNDGDIVAALFKTCSDKQALFDIIICLEQEGKLFHLLNNLKFKAFSQVCTIITSVYMTYIKKGEMGKKYADALEFGRQILFDNRTFGNHNIEEFDTVHNKLKFTTDLNLFVKIGKATLAAPFLSDMSAEDLQKQVSCNPLDIISITPVENIEKYNLKKGEIYLLPACFVYLLYNEETWETAILAAEVTVQLAFCLIGVGEIMAAIEAGSTIGVAYATAGVTIDASFGATLIPEFGKNHPVVTKYIHYAMWARLVTDFINVKGLTEELNTAIKAKKIAFEPYEATIDGVKIIKGTQKTYKPLTIGALGILPHVLPAYLLGQGGRKLLFYIERVIDSQKSVTVFFKGAEIFSGERTAAKEFMDEALVVYKNEGQIAMENFFFAKQSSKEIRFLHSQTGETYVGKLLRKGKKEYYYELHDFRYDTKKVFDESEPLLKDKFRCRVKFADPNVFPLIEDKKYFYGDIFIPYGLNQTLQNNKITGLTDLSLGETIINDGFANLTKDAGKELDGIFGQWQKNSSYVEYPGGESVNLHTLKFHVGYEMLQGKPLTKELLEQAALKTFTGKWAKSKGYGKVELYNADDQFDAIEELGDIELVTDIVFIFKK